MNQTQQNQLMASLYRQTFYARLLEMEHKLFLQFPVGSGIKNVLKRLVDNYTNGIAQVKAYMPKTGGNFQKTLDLNEDKLRAISVINEKLFILDPAQVLEIENSMDDIKISYEDISVTQAERVV